MMIKRILLALVAATALISSTLCAATDPQRIDIDLPYSMAGVVHAVRSDQNEIVISDMIYEIVPYVIVHKSNANYIGTQYLKPSMRIGFKTEGAKRLIKEVWVLD